MSKRVILAVGLVFVVSTAAAQHRHPPQNEALHEKFYPTIPRGAAAIRRTGTRPRSNISAETSTRGAGTTGITS
jgi:hypothetical protein